MYPDGGIHSTRLPAQYRLVMNKKGTGYD